MLILCLQVSPNDFIAAEELAGLIADLEPGPRRDVEFMLFYRKDIPEANVRRLVGRLEPKFPRTLMVKAWDYADGWPAGPNAMWASLMRQLFDMGRKSEIVAAGALTFEADCIPVKKDWITQLSDRWNIAYKAGYHAMGHFHPAEDSATHVNGNAVFRTDFWKLHPDVTGCHAAIPWDVAHGALIMKVASATKLINQSYRLDRFNLKDFRKISLSDCVLYHGIKIPDGRRIARQVLLKTK
jgi:hypothetical protein